MLAFFKVLNEVYLAFKWIMCWCIFGEQIITDYRKCSKHFRGKQLEMSKFSVTVRLKKKNCGE